MDDKPADLIFSDGTMQVFDITSEFSTAEEYKKTRYGIESNGQTARKAWAANNGGAGFPPPASAFDEYPQTCSA